MTPTSAWIENGGACGRAILSGVTRAGCRVARQRAPSLMGALFLALLVSLAHAKPVRFDLPAQPAATALAAFAKQAGVEVLFSFDELRAVNANAVSGEHEPDAALALLLRGTGFVGTRTAAGKFLVVRETSPGGAEIRGKVVEDATGDPVADVRVRALGGSVQTHTSADGEFVLRGVPVDTPAIVVQAEGWTTQQRSGLGLRGGERVELETIRLRAGGGTPQLDEVAVNESELMPGVFALQRVVVTPSRFGLDQERGAVAATLTETELQALPQLGEDIYRAIARMPGLVADDYTARFWVRGAPHEQVSARLDGVDLIEPFHMRDTDSSVSMVDLESINRVALYTGGFTAEHGDALAGVLTMETDSHVSDRPRTSLGLSLTGTRVGSRGALADGRGRWLVSARTGNPDIAFDGEDDWTKLKLRYYDLAGKWEFDVAPGHTVSVHALHGGDTAEYAKRGVQELTSRYASDYVWTRWRGDVGPRLKGEAVLSWAGLTWRREGQGKIDDLYATSLDDRRDLQQGGFRQDWTVDVSERVLLRGGTEFKWGEASYRYDGSSEVGVLRNGVGVLETRMRTSRAEPEGMAAGGYVSLRAQPWAAFTVEPGVRYDWNDYAGDSDVSPRLNAAWSLGRSTVRAAWGWYHQAQGLHELASRDGDTRFRRSERAEHRVLSFEHRLKSRVSVRLEAYERVVAHPRVRWGNVINNIAAFPEWADDRIRFDPVSQEARGVELVAERRIGSRWSWSGSYAWSKSEETLRDGRTVPRARDQTHTLYLDIAYAPNPRWQFSALWQSHTGWPTTEMIHALTPLEDGQVIVTRRPAALYGSRLPGYQRLDLRVQRRFQFKRSQLRLYVDVFNVLDRENVIEYGYDVSVTNGQVTQRRYAEEEQLGQVITGGVAWDF